MATPQTQLEGQQQGGNAMFMTPGQQQGMTSQGQQQVRGTLSLNIIAQYTYHLFRNNKIIILL